MNSSREEQAMLTDAARIYKEALADAGGNEIRQAVQAGIERGRRRSWLGRLRTGSLVGLAAAAVVACILFFIPMIHDLAPQSAAPAETAGWVENFKRLYPFDTEVPTLDSAIRHGYIQQVNQSASSGDYRITLNAVTADENKIIFLYTANTAAGQEIYSVNSARIKNLSTGYNLESEGQIGGHAVRKGSEKNRVYYGRGVIHLDRNQPFPEQLEADFQIASVDPGKLKDPKTGKNAAEMNYSPRLKISFKLDPKFKEQQTVTVNSEADFMLEGIQVTLKQVELSPLMTRVVIGIKNGPENTWPNRQKIFMTSGGDEIQSVTQAGTVIIRLSSGYGNDEGFEQRFGSNLLDHPESMNLILRTGNGTNIKEITVPILP